MSEQKQTPVTPSILSKMFDNTLLINPKSLLLYGYQKIGKTTAIAGLVNSIIIDFQRGTEYIDHPCKINILQTLENINNGINEANKTATPDKQVKLWNILDVIKYVANNIPKNQYDYLILDTYSDIEDIAERLATMNYRATPLGKSFNDASVLSLPQGAGYYWLRQAIEQILSLFENKAKTCLILIGHIKDSDLNKDDSKITTASLDATGKMKIKIPSIVDAVGKMYKKDENTLNVVFTSNNSSNEGARSAHLRNKDITLSILKNDVVTTYWDQIFIT